MKRKKPQKKVVVKKVEWLESPVDQECQEGKIDKITFSARLSEKEKRGKWYIGNNVSEFEGWMIDRIVITKKFNLGFTFCCYSFNLLFSWYSFRKPSMT